MKKVQEKYPVGGVIQNNGTKFLIEDIYIYNCINLTFENFLLDNELDIDNEDDLEIIEDYESNCDTYLIGYVKNTEGLYDIDYKAEYSAIVGEIYTQITHSKYISYASPCSPCFPYQNDLDTQGEYATYTFPLDIFGDCKHLEIFELIS